MDFTGEHPHVLCYQRPNGQWVAFNGKTHYKDGRLVGVDAFGTEYPALKDWTTSLFYPVNLKSNAQGVINRADIMQTKYVNGLKQDFGVLFASNVEILFLQNQPAAGV